MQSPELGRAIAPELDFRDISKLRCTNHDWTGTFDWRLLRPRRVLAAMSELFNQFERGLATWADAALSVSLVVSGTAIILAGIFAPRALKALILAWIWFP